THYLMGDQLGNIRFVVSGCASRISGRYAYDAYGHRYCENPDCFEGGTPFGYTGQYTDGESGLVYLRARYYDPATQQFLTRDPLVAETEQAYVYAGGDPLNSRDPSGLEVKITTIGPLKPGDMAKQLDGRVKLLEKIVAGLDAGKGGLAKDEAIACQARINRLNALIEEINGVITKLKN